jgi:putative endonuclease
MHHTPGVRHQRGLNGHPTDARQARGRAAEQAAAEFLMRAGHTLVARNLRLRHLEVDIVSIEPRLGALVLTEVKARCGGRHAPELRVDAAKRRHLIDAARMLLARPALRRRMVQFDVIAVTLDALGHPVDLRHMPRAFDATPSRRGRSAQRQ